MFRPEKEQYVEELAGKIREADGIILAGFQGLTYPELSTIRKAIKSQGSDFRVVKNTLLRVAMQQCDIEGMDEHLKGSTVCTIVNGDVAAIAKEIKKYDKEFDNFEIKAGYLDGTVMAQADVIRLADLPSREELLAKMLSSMNAPVSNFVSLLGNIPRSMVNVLTAIKDKKES